MTSGGYPQGFDGGVRQKRTNVRRNVKDRYAEIDYGWERGVVLPPVLATLRHGVRVEHKEVARRLGVVPSTVLRLERKELTLVQVGALQNYVRALGGQLKAQAVFGSVVIPLIGDGAPLTEPEIWARALDLR